MAEITLNAAVRANLLTLNSTQSLIDKTQNRLSTGLRVSSPIDDSKAFFEAKSLSDRASDFGEKKDGIDQAISSVKTALQAVDAVDSLVSQLKGLAISAKSASGTELASVVSQFNELRTQINNLAGDASFQGLNLVNNTTTVLTVEFGVATTSTLDITAVNLQSGTAGLSISVAAASNTTATGDLDFSATSDVDTIIAELDTAITTLRGNASALGSNVALLQTRLDFTNGYVNNLTEGAGKLTLADINEEGANLVSLQTRQQLGISALAFAGQSEQSVLSLFR